MMRPPVMAGWNLALRFGLELGAFAGLGLGAWNVAAGSVRWIAVIGVLVAAATLWGVFNVADDPSRSGAAPVEVAGWIRLAIELVILGGGVGGLLLSGQRNVAVLAAVLIAFHYAVSWSRVQWLLSR